MSFRMLLVLVGCGLSLLSFPAYAIKVVDMHPQPFKDVVQEGSHQPVPEITIYDALGKPHNLKELRGKIVLLHFWATWCPPCIHELPSLDALEHKMREMAAIGDIDQQGITVVPISLDFKGVEPVKNFYNSRRISSLPILFDKSNAAFAALGVKNLPTTIIIGPRGKEIGRVEGAYEWNSKEVTDYLFPFSEHKPKN
ncbi:MAG: TlpA family protein disulfide reductase [Alphaproteobacteria bacterium]|nr:TlpA family protein disulfide reductase [Alphaproteobacteria bacterium]